MTYLTYTLRNHETGDGLSVSYTDGHPLLNTYQDLRALMVDHDQQAETTTYWFRVTGQHDGVRFDDGDEDAVQSTEWGVVEGDAETFWVNADGEPADYLADGIRAALERVLHVTDAMRAHAAR